MEFPAQLKKLVSGQATTRGAVHYRKNSIDPLKFIDLGSPRSETKHPEKE